MLRVFIYYFRIKRVTPEKLFKRGLSLPHTNTGKLTDQWRTEGEGVWGGSTPPPQIPKALQNRAKLNPIVKNVKNCWI